MAKNNESRDRDVSGGSPFSKRGQETRPNVPPPPKVSDVPKPPPAPKKNGK